MLLKRFNNWFFYFFLLWIILGGAILMNYPKDELHLLINSGNHPVLDHFFYYFTDVGDGIFAAILFLILLFFSRKLAFQTGVSVLVASLFTQLLKRNVFADCHRPAKYFQDHHHLHLIDGLEMHSNYSFPSGHATLAFALFTCLALYTKNKWAQIILFIVTLVTAFSRVYLSQHFLEDIYAGSVVGVVFSFVIYFLLDKKINEKHDSPIQIKRKK